MLLTRRSATQSGLRESTSSEGSDAFPVWRFCNAQIESSGEVDGGVRVVPRAGDDGECGASAHADDGEGGEEDGVRGVGKTTAVEGGEVQREEEGGVEEERVLVFVGTKREGYNDGSGDGECFLLVGEGRRKEVRVGSTGSRGRGR